MTNTPIFKIRSFHAHPRKPLQGFTLIELLVVVAIIALLVSFLLPSLQKARNLTRGAVCMSNQKQFGLSAMMYINDFNDTLPPVKSSSSPQNFWFYGNGSLGRYMWPNEIINEHNVKLRCPSYGGDTPPYGSPMTNLNVDICYFNSWKSSVPQRYRKLQNIVPAPSGVVLMRDMRGFKLEWASFWVTGYYSVWPGYLDQPWFRADWHNNGFIALFLDMHASMQESFPATVETWGNNIFP